MSALSGVTDNSLKRYENVGNQWQWTQSFANLSHAHFPVKQGDYRENARISSDLKCSYVAEWRRFLDVKTTFPKLINRKIISTELGMIEAIILPRDRCSGRYSDLFA